jgi:hypothetical protein
MVFSFYIMITWLAITSFALYARKLSIIENLFIFMIITMVIFNKVTLVSLNFGYVETTKEHVLYLCHLLNRNVVIPVTLLLCCNIFYSAQKKVIKYSAIFMTLLLLILLERLAIYFDIYTYKNWSLLIESLFLLLYILLILLIAKWFRKRLKKDGILVWKQFTMITTLIKTNGL